MRFHWLLVAFLTSCGLFTPPQIRAEKSEVVQLATHIGPAMADKLALERIRKIVLSQGDDSRALANLVQLSRDQPAEVAAQLYSDLADDYLRLGKYDQAANLLQQLLNQYADQPVAGPSLVKLLRLYSSSEVTHTQTPSTSSATKAKQAASGFLRYAAHVAETSLQKNSRLANNPALHFQQAVIARRDGQAQAAAGRLTKLKHNSQAGQWRKCARIEQWLNENREGEPAKPVVICHQAAQRPHLDGKLDDVIWQSKESVRLAYDREYLYFALHYPKVAKLTYQADNQPRTYDADLSAHDHVRIRLDLDRDYTTCFELEVDHRGHTNDRCWLATEWNPKWFVAAGQQSENTHWTIEAAVPWEQLTREPPQSGTAWAIDIQRILPIAARTTADSTRGARPASSADFSLLLFE